MPARKPKPKITMIEFMIIIAIMGILGSIVIPASQQARRRALQASPSTLRSHAQQVPPDGQLNTIEVSRLAEGESGGPPINWFGLIFGLIPIAIPVIVVAAIISRFRQQMKRQRAHE